MSKLCIWALLGALAWLTLLANSAVAETRIEVDENGDEFELKRFYIQGRQLNGSGSKSQCVVTRRKRNSRAVTELPAAVTAAVNTSSTAAEAVTAAVNKTKSKTNSKRRYVAVAALLQNNNDEDEDEDEDDEQDEEELLPLLQLPAAGAAPAAQLPQGISVLAQSATQANVGDAAGIVVVQSQQPPKVNPSTHAVFELKPLGQSQRQQLQDYPYWLQDVEDYAEEAGDDDDLDFYYGAHEVDDKVELEHYITEESPVSSTLIWSTDDQDQDEPQRRRPNKHKRKQQKQQKKQKRKQQRRPAQQNVPLDMLEEQPLKKKKQEQQLTANMQSTVNGNVNATAPIMDAAAVNTQKRKPAKANKNKRKQTQKRKNKNKRRRQPSNSLSSSSGSGSIGGYKRRRPQQALTPQQRRRLQQQRRRRQEQLRRRRRRNKQRLQQQQFNNRRPYFGDEPIINCIYINKDPTTTTPRPFWNILGRDAEANDDAADSDVAAAAVPLQRRSSEFGQRKRANLKFVA
ncbi:cancer-related regulator of actin dynamics homolog [Drosophila busckii]|uniref:cancer-related regulator of actin dynamics homolog n=1 Tax=Drosophila busckii TaxID=30019 RepID=UPI00083F36E9|nr:cancer-related regulator of actin dynamics homolog [Drosophila busckii]